MKISTLILLIFSQVAGAQVTELNCMHVMPIQLRFLQRHVNFAQLTPELEKRTQILFLKRLDPIKVFLTAPDMKEIESQMRKIFEKTRSLDCGPVIKANEILVKRWEERLDFAKKYLGPDFKIDKAAKFIPNVDDRPRPKTVAEANRYFSSQLQFEVARFVASDIALEKAKHLALVGYERYFKHMREMKNKDLFANYLDIYASALDPHSNYMSPDGTEDFEIQMRLSLDGIGATLGWRDGFTTVEALIPGGAAALSGLLKRHDKIIGVGQGEVGPFTDIMEMELRDAIRLIRGPKGTKVRLQVLRKAGKETQKLEIPLVRDKIKLEDAAASISYVDREVGGRKIKVGLLNLPSFYHDERKDGPTAATDLKKLLAEAVKNGAGAIVLDLSNDGGGSLPDAVDVVGLFIAKGNVVRIGMRGEVPGGPLVYQSLEDKDPAVDWAGPLVILINRQSASASEIVSGALQDYQRAVIVGSDHTFGKGTMQAVEGLPPGLGATKITSGMFFTAGGQSTQHRGVTSDIAFPGIYPPQGKDGEKAMEYSLPPKKIDAFLSPEARSPSGPGSWTPLSGKILKGLRATSSKRIAKTPDFMKVKDEIRKVKPAEKVILVGSLFKDKPPEKKTKEKKDDDEDDTPAPSKEEWRKRYLERADVIESVNIAADLAVELSQ